MIRQENTQAADHFPLRESYVDCRGTRREFIIDFVRSDDQRFLRAVEAVDLEGRYEFAAMSETDPFLALESCGKPFGASCRRDTCTEKATTWSLLTMT
ncbi:DUF7686 domain-containing protein [Longimicrobium sp.]|uniref:DUF7686 domain-containing protein n=1 Tax=Longimicrobium sp. TaxID=2029185 RepID=UPI002E2FD9E8|nr:hypothetical protein [Longimicrobium sp.]HEX6039218.1 hypothetical protein [Longimicrobium sp.]